MKCTCMWCHIAFNLVSCYIVIVLMYASAFDSFVVIFVVDSNSYFRDHNFIEIDFAIQWCVGVVVFGLDMSGLNSRCYF